MLPIPGVAAVAGVIEGVAMVAQGNLAGAGGALVAAAAGLVGAGPLVKGGIMALKSAHGGLKHWKRITQTAQAMGKKGWIDIRINKQQVDAMGKVVGKNRPDISGINPKTGQRHNIEFDTKAASSRKHTAKVNANDPNAKNTFIIMK